MRKLILLGAALALAAFAAGRAAAAALPVEGTLSVVLGPLGSPQLTGSGVGTSNGAFGLAAIPAGLLALTGTRAIAISPPALGLGQITLMGPVGNASGSFDPGGAMGNDGVANLFFTNGAAAGSVPLAYIGGGGTGMLVLTGLPVTVIGATWTNLGASAADPTRTTTIMEVAAGFAVTVTATAFDRRTAGGVGTLQLVAPVVARLVNGDLGQLPIVGVLTLRFVPEPGTLLLLGSGVLGLVAFGRRCGRV
jgi:hypothetical protein